MEFCNPDIIEQSLWIKVVSKINSLKKEFPNDKFIHVNSQWITREFKHDFRATVNMYILLLAKAGYLKKIVPDHYTRVKEIPLDISMKKFFRNYLGHMLWTEQVLTFYNLYQNDKGE
jgi:hypothetical protein